MNGYRIIKTASGFACDYPAPNGNRGELALRATEIDGAVNEVARMFCVRRKDIETPLDIVARREFGAQRIEEITGDRSN